LLFLLFLVMLVWTCEATHGVGGNASRTPDCDRRYAEASLVWKCAAHIALEREHPRRLG